jgi:hypothetical protein
MKLRLYAIAAALGISVGLGSIGALAQDKSDKSGKSADASQAKAEEAVVAAEVVVLHATNDGSGIDPNIGKMPELGKPPFSSYNSYKLLDRVKLSLAKGKSSTQKLPNDRVLMVSLKDIVPGKKKDEPKKYVVSASIQKPGGNVFLPLLEVNAKAGEIFFVAGQTHKGGVLVIGIKVAP